MEEREAKMTLWSQVIGRTLEQGPEDNLVKLNESQEIGKKVI